MSEARGIRRRTWLAAAVGSVVVGALTRSEELPCGQRLYVGSDFAFGTRIAVKLLHTDQRQAELAIEDAFHEAKKVDTLMSIHSENSQVFRLNRDGRLQNPDPHLLHVLEQARALSELTNGAFDVTVQALWLKFSQAAALNALPSEEERRRAQSLVNWKQLHLAPDQVRFGQAGMTITLNGLAQGYAVDLALAAVQARGVQHALLDTGEFGASGTRTPEHPWALGVQDPRQPDHYTSTLQLDGRSVATSGDYETCFTPDFAHHHIFDPATADSPLELASVTVLAPTGLLADGLSTAFMVMGSAKALALASQLDQIDVLLVDKQGSVWKTPGLHELKASHVA